MIRDFNLIELHHILTVMSGIIVCKTELLEYLMEIMKAKRKQIKIKHSIS